MISCKQSEYELIRRAKQGEGSATETLLMQHRVLIHMIAKRFSYAHAAQQDLIQAGCLGLICAIRRFDLNREVLLKTYAVPWILGEMKKAAKQCVTREASLDSLYGEKESALVDRLVDPAGYNSELIDLRFALQHLPHDELIVIVLRYTRDKTQSETARLLRKSQAQISKIEKKAIAHLRTLMD